MDRAKREFRSIAPGNHSVPTTTDENSHHVSSKRECQQAAHHAIELVGSLESKFSPHKRYASHHVREFLPRRPARRLAEAAVGCEGEFLCRCVFQAKTDALGDIARSFDVITFHINDSDGRVNAVISYVANHFDLRKLTACHLQVHLI